VEIAEEVFKVRSQR